MDNVLSKDKQTKLANIMTYLDSIITWDSNEEWAALEAKVHAKLVTANRRARFNNKWKFKVGDLVMTHSMKRSRDKGTRNGIVARVTEVWNGMNTIDLEVVEPRRSRTTVGEKLTHLPIECVKPYTADGAEPVAVVEEVKTEEKLKLESLYSFLGA